MSLPGATVEQLLSDAKTCVQCDGKNQLIRKQQQTISDLMDAIERLKEVGEALELANHTLKRRVVSLEQDRK